MKMEYNISYPKKGQRNEDHLKDLNESEKALIKHMARMIVNHVVRKVEQENREVIGEKNGE
jgi:hypothetical protein